jgi:hypothetical protein
VVLVLAVAVVCRRRGAPAAGARRQWSRDLAGACWASPSAGGYRSTTPPVLVLVMLPGDECSVAALEGCPHLDAVSIALDHARSLADVGK